MALTIQSPGVQIIETDLSQTIAIPGGTSVLVPGFAAQGPTDEILQITSISEFEQIFGLPASPAERYFYYSSAAVLNSNGNLLATRLPYGSGAGAGFAPQYSGLFYPAASAGTAVYYTSSTPITGGVLQLSANTTAQAFLAFETLSSVNINTAVLSSYSTTTIGGSSLWTFAYVNQTFLSASNSQIVFGAPTHVTFSEDVYNNLLHNNFVWKTTLPTYTGSTPTFSFTPNTGSVFTIVNGVNTLEGGLVILNQAQTTIDEAFQGYYVNISDNSGFGLNVPFTQANAIISLSGNDLYSQLPTSNLSFALTGAAGTFGSLSEQIESIPNFSFGNPFYNDSLVVTVFKLRNSSYQPNVLTNALAEAFVGSLDSTKKDIARVGGIPKTAYIGDILNNNSSNINVNINPVISRANYHTSNGSPNPTTNVRVAANALYPLGIYSPTYDQVNANTIGDVNAKLNRVLTLIDSPDKSKLDLVLDAGLSTIFANTSGGSIATFNDQLVADTASLSSQPTSSTIQYWQTIFNTFNNFVQNTRKDCMYIADPLRQIFVNGTNLKTLEVRTNNFTQNIYTPLQQLFTGIDTNYSATYANWVKVYDSFSDNFAWVPASGYVAGIYANNDTLTQPWIAPAGLNRGIIRNIVDIGFNPNQKQRDYLYTLSMNPICLFPGDGYVVFGQKTLQAKPSAFDRVNVRRLFLTLERAVQRAVKYFVFEPNTTFTRTRLVNTIKPIFSLAQNTEGLYDYKIVCDTRNNTPDTIDRNQLNVDIYIKPTRAAEFILVNFIATRTSQDFNELI